ncbi:MAG: hypothetical protein K6L74_08950 [Neptuniibacter sp.]
MFFLAPEPEAVAHQSKKNLTVNRVFMLQ